MNEITQHIPNFVTGFDPEVAEFSTLDELRAIPFVAGFRNHFDAKFHRYSQADYHGKWLLVAEFDEGYVWWVVGVMNQPVDGVPAFTPKKREMNGHENFPAGDRT